MTVLPSIPVLDLSDDWPVAALDRLPHYATALLDGAQGWVPGAVLRLADGVSRRWMERAASPALGEIDRVSARLRRPGAHFLNVSYEWGCSTIAAPGPDGETPRLARVLDWHTRGLGRWAVALRITGSAGPWTTIGWPGYAGVLQGVAPGRFAAALNQAPMAKPTGIYPADWAVNAARVWRRPRLTPALLLRQVFETAGDFGDACAMLRSTPLSSGAIFVIAGVRPGETAVIERTPDAAGQPEGLACAVNAWQQPGWQGRPRGQDNPGRLAAMASLAPDFGEPAAWLAPPVLNDTTRLVFVADPVSGRFLVQGWEACRPVTAPLIASALPSDEPCPVLAAAVS
jgi:hypothetical protein